MPHIGTQGFISGLLCNIYIAFIIPSISRKQSIIIAIPNNFFGWYPFIFYQWLSDTVSVPPLSFIFPFPSTTAIIFILLSNSLQFLPLFLCCTVSPPPTDHVVAFFVTVIGSTIMCVLVSVSVCHIVAVVVPVSGVASQNIHSYYYYVIVLLLLYMSLLSYFLPSC